MSAILRYYEGSAPDDRGRYLSEIQRWPDASLEAVHDFIQWTFPLAEPSGANPGAPVLDEEAIREFRSRPELHENLRTSFLRMLRFYGLEFESGVVKRAGDLRSKTWLTPGNHNHLRITRIIKSLKILGLESEARAFFECLTEIYASHRAAISPATFRYWESALK
jgi:hypothetical protein